MAFSEGYKWNFRKNKDIGYTNAVLDDQINQREYPGPQMLKENGIVATSDSRHDFRKQNKLDREQFLV